MKFLVTNDDGIDAAGLAVLVRAVAELGQGVVVADGTCRAAVIKPRPTGHCTYPPTMPGSMSWMARPWIASALD